MLRWILPDGNWNPCFQRLPGMFGWKIRYRDRTDDGLQLRVLQRGHLMYRGHVRPLLHERDPPGVLRAQAVLQGGRGFILSNLHDPWNGGEWAWLCVCAVHYKPDNDKWGRSDFFRYTG